MNIICGIRTNRYNMFVMGNIQIVRGGIVYKIWCRYLAWLTHSQVELQGGVVVVCQCHSLVSVYMYM